MAGTTTRALALLNLLQTHRSWTGPELASRLEVSERTLRRDVERLRDLGYRIESAPGADGGYRLEAGSAVPPLLLTDEEAVTMAVGLRLAAIQRLTGGPETSLSALAKLEQVLPARLRRRVNALAGFLQPTGPDGPLVSPEDLGEIALACRDRERMRFASDLHDIQGHTLHVVNLKIALAEELLRRDPERAMVELREVYAQVEETIRETKNLAYAQRKLNIRAELENARNLLDAAGVTVRITRGGEIRADIGELLGQVLREATTNILRHAQATRVSVILSETGIEILNDGAADGGLPALRGLETLRARVANEGGSLTVEQSNGEFRTVAQLPARAPGLRGAPVEPTERSAP